ncbi:BQ5605_C007g04617 [Microbotryum silenes-dioicae]|uniref:BQ5605_C007g04617 protein n=1 Tax=Microbotryum silenes-dioicae TaxID=796604 RepID=A0A2X0M7F5_9BASI|nr:BQ5605_C007g04617 [Microbotryum silenes-dioicae]
MLELLLPFTGVRERRREPIRVSVPVRSHDLGWGLGLAKYHWVVPKLEPLRDSMRTPPVTILPDELLHRIFCFVQSEPLSTAPLPSSRRAGSLSTAPSAPATSLGNAISFQLARIRASLECLRNQNGQAERISQRMDQMGLYGLSTDRSSPELMASRARVAALRSFSLVHRRWTPIAQRLLFSSVAITHELQAKEMFHSLTPRTHRFQSLSITGVSNGAVEALLSRVQAVAQLRLALVQESHNAVGFQGSMLLSPGLKDLDTLVLGDPFRFTDWPDSWPTHLRRLSITSSAFFDSSEQGHSRPVTRHLPPTLSELHFRMRGADQLPHQLHLLIEALPSNSFLLTMTRPTNSTKNPTPTIHSKRLVGSTTLHKQSPTSFSPLSSLPRSNTSAFNSSSPT